MHLNSKPNNKPNSKLLAAGQGSGKLWGTGLLGGHNMPDETYASGNARVLTQDLYARLKEENSIHVFQEWLEDLKEKADIMVDKTLL